MLTVISIQFLLDELCLKHVILWELQMTKLLVLTLQIDLQRYTLNNT